MISEISGGLIDIDSLAADLWVDTASNEVHRVMLTDKLQVTEDQRLRSGPLTSGPLARPSRSPLPEV